MHFQELFHCAHQDALNFGCDSGDSSGFIASLTVSDLGADVAGARLEFREVYLTDGFCE